MANIMFLELWSDCSTRLSVKPFYHESTFFFNVVLIDELARERTKEPGLAGDLEEDW